MKRKWIRFCAMLVILLLGLCSCGRLESAKGEKGDTQTVDMTQKNESKEGIKEAFQEGETPKEDSQKEDSQKEDSQKEDSQKDAGNEVETETLDSATEKSEGEVSEMSEEDVINSAKADSENNQDASQKNESLSEGREDIKKEDTKKEDTSKVNVKTPSLATPSVSGALQVKGAQLVDKNGKSVQLKGLSTHGLAWYPQYVNEACFKELREEWNVNVIRLAMYTAEYGGYCSGGNKEDLKKLIKDGVTFATNQDMYVIIDWHILSDQNPNTHKAEAKKFFEEMAQLYADYDNVLYEICNEPNGGTTWRDVKSYANEVIPVIRKYDKDGIILVGSPTWSQNVDLAAADPITGYENIMYTLHFYAATHKESLRNTMTAAINAGLPVFVSEYGICDASGNGAIDEASAADWVSTMNAYGVSYVAWALANKAETAAIISSSCNKTSGFSQNDLSNSGKWLYKMLTGKTNFKELDKNASPDSNRNNNHNNNQQNNANVNQSPVQLTNGDLALEVTLKNSWTSEDKTFYQYSLLIKNKGTEASTSWAVDIAFDGRIEFSQGWCGNFSVKGKTLHITSADFNGALAVGGQISDVGFIISGPADLSVKK